MLKRLFPSNKISLTDHVCHRLMRNQLGRTSQLSPGNSEWENSYSLVMKRALPCPTSQAWSHKHICLVSKLTCFQWEGGPCILATISKEKDSWTFVFLWAEWILYLFDGVSPYHTMSSARNSASKAYPIASICQQPWQRSSIRAVVLEAGLFQGRLPAAGLPDLSLS